MRALGTAALIVAGVVAGCYVGLLALRDPGRGNAAAARAVTWLGRYRESDATLFVDGRRLKADCLRGWLGRRRGTLLTLGNGASIRDLPPHTLLVRGALPRPVAVLNAAGCTRVLADRLASLAEFRGGIGASAVRLDGARALAIRFPNLTLYVHRGSNRPFAVRNRWAHGTFVLGKDSS